ncbi:MAG TPA: hypothetical protein VEK57_16635 [Thermoanaerobaculia bacterium]|nr:hypothetical protein [Thermoanaerobaculia bacterium]
MTPLTALWLPILLSAVFVFIASSIIHMLPLWHKSDYPALPNQDQAADAIRPLAIPPGEFMIPRAATMADMKTPEFTERMVRGPVMILTVLPNGRAGMGKPLVLWFVYSLLVSYFAAYIAGRALAPGTDYLEVFRFAGATAFIGYAVALWQMSIWFHRPWSSSIKATFDGLIYACLTAGVFGWLWPHA